MIGKFGSKRLPGDNNTLYAGMLFHFAEKYGKSKAYGDTFGDEFYRRFYAGILESPNTGDRKTNALMIFASLSYAAGEDLSEVINQGMRGGLTKEGLDLFKTHDWRSEKAVENFFARAKDVNRIIQW